MQDPQIPMLYSQQNSINFERISLNELHYLGLETPWPVEWFSKKFVFHYLQEINWNKILNKFIVSSCDTYQKTPHGMGHKNHWPLPNTSQLQRSQQFISSGIDGASGNMKTISWKMLTWKNKNHVNTPVAVNRARRTPVSERCNEVDAQDPHSGHVLR